MHAGSRVRHLTQCVRVTPEWAPCDPDQIRGQTRSVTPRATPPPTGLS